MSKYFGIFKDLKKLDLPVGDMDLYEGYFAEFYDQLTGVSVADLDKFLPHIERKDGPVLELGCGTGRLLIKIAQQGYKITGLDLSQSMLNILNRKLLNEPCNIRSNVSLYKKDMTSFDINNKFATCILGATSICLLPDDDAVLEMLQTVHKHLEPGGRFIFDYSVCPESPKTPIEIDPVHTFTQTNELEKQFVLFSERKDYINMISTVNFYAETIDKELQTVRNFGNTQKRLLTDKMISSIIKLSPFELVDFDTQVKGNYKIRFVVLEKGQ